MVSHEQSVLIVHPDPAVRSGLVAALAPRRIIAVGSRADAARTLAERIPDAVIADAALARKLMQDLERLAPQALRVFLCAQGHAEAVRELVDVAAQGYEFHTVDPSSMDELVHSVRELLRQRASMRVPAAGLEATFHLGGGLTVRAECLNVGNEGFLLKLPVDAPIEQLPPGTRIYDFRLEREGKVVLRTGGGFVRHIGLERSSGDAFFRIGVQIERAGANIGYMELATIDDLVRILAVLRRALRRQGTLQCTLVQGVRRQEELPATLEEGAEGIRPVLRCAMPKKWGVVVGDVVQVVFDLSGKSYRGWSAVVKADAEGFTLSLPRSLSMYHRRSSMRFRTGEDRPFSVSFRSPITGERIEHPVVDMHTVGLAFAYDAAREVLPAGLIIEDFELVLPDGTRAPCRAEVRDNAPLLNPTAGMARPFRCGMRLLNVMPEARQAVVDAFVQARCPQVRDGRNEPFRNIWKLVQTMRLFHPDYPLEEGPHLDLLEDTHRKLAASGEGVAKTFIYSEGPQIMGHVSGVRTHSRTWMFQHLIVLPTFHRSERISRELSALCVDYAEALEDVNYLRVFWRIENKWPDRVYGWIARSMFSEGLTDLRTLNYTRLPFTQPLRTRPGLPVVREATRADYQWLESHLRGRGEVVRLLADDLLAHEADMTGLRARYAAQGLRRGRSLFVVDGEHGPLAMALAEDATPGISWPENTTAFSFVTPDPLNPWVPEAREALTARCVDFYKDAGKVSALALVQDDEVEGLVMAGFRWHCRVAQWTFHRNAARTWHMLMAAVFERLQQRRAARASRDLEERAA